MNKNKLLMVAFEFYQTVPMISLQDMDPFMQIQPQDTSFPLPGEEFTFVRLDLSRALIKNPLSTFFIQINTIAMIEEGHFPGDVLIVDRTMEPRTGFMAIVYLEEEFLFCRLDIHEHGIRLHFANSEWDSIEVEPDLTFNIWGIVRDVLHMDGKVLE
jgi:DNA polymerase V